MGPELDRTGLAPLFLGEVGEDAVEESQGCVEVFDGVPVVGTLARSRESRPIDAGLDSNCCESIEQLVSELRQRLTFDGNPMIGSLDDELVSPHQELQLDFRTMGSHGSCREAAVGDSERGVPPQGMWLQQRLTNGCDEPDVAGKRLPRLGPLGGGQR